MPVAVNMAGCLSVLWHPMWIWRCALGSDPGPWLVPATQMLEEEAAERSVSAKKFPAFASGDVLELKLVGEPSLGACGVLHA